MFGFSFWLLGCSIPSSKSSFPPPNQAASAARRIFIFSIRTSAFTGGALCAVRWNALFGFSFWLLGCSILSSQSSFPPPNQAASAARRIFIFSDPNVSVHPRRTLCAVVVERLVGFHFHRLFLASRPEIVSAGFVTFVLLWWKIHCARSCQYIS